MPASLPGSTLAQNLANPTLGAFVIFDPLSGPKGNILDADKQVDIITGVVTASGKASTGALCTGIGIGENDIIGPNPSATFKNQAGYIFQAGFNDNDIPGEANTYAAGGPPPVVSVNTVDSSMMYIGGGKCSTPVNGYAAPTPYTAGVAICGAGNGGSRDAGAGPAFTGFGMKMVTAAAPVAVGAVVETGFVNRSTRQIETGESIFGSASAANAAPS